MQQDILACGCGVQGEFQPVQIEHIKSLCMTSPRAETVVMQGTHRLWHKKGWYTGDACMHAYGAGNAATHCFAGGCTVHVRCTAAESRHAASKRYA